MIMPSQCTLTNARALRTVMRDYRRSRAELEPLISKRLRKILVPACQHVPYYRDVMSSAGYDPVRDCRGPADLQHLPILTKELLKKQGERRFVREDADVELEVLLVMDATVFEGMRLPLGEQLRNEFAGLLSFELSRVEHLEADPNGKFKRVISEGA